MENKSEKIIELLKSKSTVKQSVFGNTFEAFNQVKEIIKDLEKEYSVGLEDGDKEVDVKYNNRGPFQAELKVAGDLMVFGMHTNVFEFDRDHGVWKTSYVESNKMSTFSGIINIYNFLADSFRYNRMDDVGYLVARIFINKDKHFFVEGKRQMGYYTDFGNSVITKEALRTVIESSILYALDFDLLVPPYDRVKVASVDKIH